MDFDATHNMLHSVSISPHLLRVLILILFGSRSYLPVYCHVICNDMYTKYPTGHIRYCECRSNGDGGLGIGIDWS
jgi:hypothetical protein